MSVCSFYVDGKAVGGVYKPFAWGIGFNFRVFHAGTVWRHDDDNSGAVELPSSLPTPLPSSLPTPLPSSLPTPLPSALPSASSLPTPLPSNLPTPLPSSLPTPLPLPTASHSPSPKPTVLGVVYSSGTFGE